MFDEKTMGSDIIIILVGGVQLLFGTVIWLVKSAVKSAGEKYTADRELYKSDKQIFHEEMRQQEKHIATLYSKVNSALAVISAHDETVDNLKNSIKEIKDDCRHNREKGVHQ